MVRLLSVVVPSLTITVAVSATQEPAAPAVADAVARVGDYVERYLSVARTIVARESVTLQPLDRDGRAEGGERRLAYETRVEWEPGSGDAEGTATVQRQLLTVDGRGVAPGTDAGCLVPESPEPLAFLLPPNRARFAFTAIAPGSLDGQAVLVLAYEPLQPGTPSLHWLGDCGRFELPGLVRGRVTLHPETFAVLRLDSELAGPVRIPVAKDQRRPGMGESLTAERSDVSIVFEAVRFRDPDETLLLPTRIRRLTVVRTPEVRRLEVTQRLSGYRRFLTDVRIQIPNPTSQTPNPEPDH